MDRRIVERRGRMKFTCVIRADEVWAAPRIVEPDPEPVVLRKKQKETETLRWRAN